MMTRAELAAVLAGSLLIGAGWSAVAAKAKVKQHSAAPRKVVRRLPAAASVTLQLGDQVTIGGVTYQVQATLVPAGTPTPPPVAVTVTGYSANPVTAGAALAINGAGFTPGLTATWNGAALPVTISSSSQLAAQAPSVTVAATAPVIVAGVTGPPLTVQPGSVPPPGYIDSFRNARRDFVTTAMEGDAVYMDGRGFGAVAGKVVFDMTIPVTLTAWSDAEIALVLPHVAGTPHVPYIQVRGPDGTLRAFLNNGGLTITPRLAPVAKKRR